jgi:cytochrome P450
MRDAPLEICEWVDDLVIVGGERGEHAGVMLMQFLGEEVARRQQSLGDDVLSAMLTSTFEGRPLRVDDEILPMTLLLLLAGLETTASAIAVSVLYLLDHPEQRARLMAEPEIWDHAIEEFLRWITPSPAASRTLRHDGEVLGCPIPAGERVMLLFGSGNRDEREFPDPDKVILDRRPNRHLAFGMGPHRCIGSHLAKLEMKIALQRVLPELDSWQVSHCGEIVWKAAETRGLSHLPLIRKSR